MTSQRIRASALLAAAGAVALLSACGGTENGGTASATPHAGSGENAIVYEARGPNATNVYTIDPDSGDFAQLTQNTDKGFDGQPAWNPERNRIIFVSDRENKRNITDIYTMSADGSDVRQITATPDVAERAPKYSPDGQYIAYVVEREDAFFLAVSSADGTQEEVVAGPMEFIEFPSWKRDGSEIYFAAITEGTQGVDILSLDVATKRVNTRISTPGADVCPHFTHDGSYLTYARSPGAPNEPPDLFRHDLASSDVTGADDVQLTDSPGRDDYANPSPDDQQFVFLSNRDDIFDLYIMDRDGGNVRRLTNTVDLRENVPDW